MRHMVSAIAALCLVLSVTPVFADAPVTHGYQAEAYVASCPNGCNVVLPATTEANTLVQHVSCSFYVTSPGVVQFAELRGSQPITNVLPVFAFPTVAGSTEYGINADVNFYYLKGYQPIITLDISGGTAGGVDCSVFGYY